MNLPLDRTVLSASYGGVTVSIWYDRHDVDRQVFAYRIADVDGAEILTGADLRSGARPFGAPVDLPDMLRSLLTFLSAWAEAGEDGENADLFDAGARDACDWAELADTLGMDLEVPEYAEY